MGTPRDWLEDGKTITVNKAATYFGYVNYKIHSRVSSGEIEAILDPPRRNPPEEIVLRLRHPEKKKIQSVTVNSISYQNYNADREVIYLTRLSDKVKIIAKY